MAGTQTAISLAYDSDPVYEVLDRFIEKVSNTQPAMMEIAHFLEERTRDHFDNEEDPDGNPWAPLKAATIKRKQRKGVPVDKILHGETLHLRDTIFPFWSADEAGLSTGPGTDAYAATQQLGDESRNIEARSFFGLSDEDEVEVIDILDEFIQAEG
ncbi:phage virion morphogenesis (putative tail completion) protein [Amphritea atlantica]|uniref:Phage virion morphogenesis (Putative tail completion) protein n=1 Tax=Amphritea atlantica TaxID=355243 RepID=A0A1H9EFZ5_9GAMM|nr:phage virion morphogenesis protein [Amphritea atlantica]SEQ24555.1 phage virion morphogenesis (putative tail completion) protein [Amphritea atlantica]